MRRMAVLVGSLLISLLGMGAAQAHAELEFMTPAAGSIVTSAPPSIALTFGESLSELGSTIVVLDPGGNAMQTGEPRVAGATIEVDLLPLTVEGTYHVNFRVMSEDGHIVNDSETFTFSPAAEPTASVDPVLVPSPETSAVTADSPTIAFWILGFLVILTAFGAAIALRARR